MTDERRAVVTLLHRSSFIAHRSVLLLLLFLAACAREPKQHNVLFITLDTFRADHLDRAPNLRALQAVRFDNAISPVPLTLPAHASILSGALPLHHGLRNNGIGVFPEDRETLATVLARDGWRTGAFIGAFVLDHRFGLNRGFEIYDDEIPRDPNAGTSLEAERRADVVVDRALAWLKQSDARPFFAWVHLYDAHAPYTPSYEGEVAFVDAQVARLLAGVDRASTVIAIVGDHGESLGEHGESTHGLLLYQPTLHVPMLVAAPGLQPRRVAQPVSAIDLPATVASLAGTKMTVQDGRDLAGDLRAGRDPKPSDLYAETQYPLAFGWSELSSLRRGNLKLIAPNELYDLARDPKETTSILSDQRRLFRDFEASLQQLRATAVTATAPVDEETRRKLAALGYIAPGGAAKTNKHPKEMAPLFSRFESANRANDANALEALVREDPSNSVFRASLARVLGSSPRALDLLRESVALAPRDPDAWYNLGAALQSSGNFDEAATALAEVIRLDPRRADAHNTLGVVLAERGKLPEAEATLRRALAIDSRDARAWNSLGNVLQGMRRAADAAEAYRTAIALAPRYADPHNGLGSVLVQGGLARDAVGEFDAAIAIEPQHWEAHLNRGIALQESGDRAGAAAQYRDLLARLPRDPAFDRQRVAARTLLGALRNQTSSQP